jgi:hypothetical protein
MKHLFLPYYLMLQHTQKNKPKDAQMEKISLRKVLPFVKMMQIVGNRLVVTRALEIKNKEFFS